MDLRDLTYLAASESALSFTAAAHALGINCTSVSRRIAKIENELGVTLFERGPFGIRLTDAGRSIMLKVRRALDDLSAIADEAQGRGKGCVGLVRLGLRMPPVGEPIRGLLAGWREACSDVSLTVFELNDHDLRAAIVDRRLDAALIPRHALWPRANAVPLYRERVLAALPDDHSLASCDGVTWAQLRSQPVLTQEWEGSHTAREFFASLLGGGVEFRAHAASKQSVLALVAAGFGVTLVTESQATLTVPGVIYRPIQEDAAWVDVDLTWGPGMESPVVGRFISYLRDGARSDRPPVAALATEAAPSAIDPTSVAAQDLQRSETKPTGSEPMDGSNASYP